MWLVSADTRGEGTRDESLRASAWEATQRQFSENICLEDDLRFRISGTFVVKFLAASPRVFEHLKNGIIAHL